MKRPVVVITGDSRGLGGVIAEMALKEGFEVVGISRRPLPEQGSSYWHIAADITKDPSGIIDTIVAKVGVPQLFINNAVAYIQKRIEDQTYEEIELQVKTNLLTPLALMQALLPHYKKEGLHKNIFQNRSIINVSSAGMHQKYIFSDPRPMGLYCATKAALSALSLAASKEFIDFGVRVNTLAPTSFSHNEERTDRLARLCIDLGRARTNGALLE